MTSNTSDFNSDELEPPEWMAAEFFVEVLQNCEPTCEGLEVKKYNISPASGKGDHLGSVMFRAKVEYCIDGVNKIKLIIVKTLPDADGSKKNWLSKLRIFETEIGVYTQVLPRFEQILRNAGDNTVLKAPCLYHQLSPRKIIVFEDIVPYGYTVLHDRTITDEEVKAAYLKLAKWHAVSYKLNLEEPDLFEQYRHGLLNMSNISENAIMTDGIKSFITSYKTEPGLSDFVPYFEKMETDWLEKAQACFLEYRKSPQPDDYYVLCHGDFHSKNMMFKRSASDGRLEDVMLLDFQFALMGPIALDLIYSIFTLLTDEMREDFPEYLYYYFTHFKETLQKIGFEGPMPRLLQLREQMTRHRHFELFLLITFLPLWYAILVGKYEPSEMMTSSEMRMSLYEREECKKTLKKLLRKYLHLGYLEE